MYLLVYKHIGLRAPPYR